MKSDKRGERGALARPRYPGTSRLRNLSAPAALVLLLCAVAPAQADKKAGHVRPADPVSRPVDRCDAAQMDPQELAERGFQIYQEAVRLEEERQRVRELERSVQCYMVAMDNASAGAAKVYHPLGLALEKLGRYPEAVDAFERFLALVPEKERKAGVTKQITDKIATLRQQVAALAIDTVPGLTVRIDEKVVGKAPLGRLLSVIPGSHAVVVGDPETGTLGTQVLAQAGQVHRVDLTGWRPRRALSMGIEERRAAASAKRSPARPWVWVVVGVTGVLVAGTAVALGTYYGTGTPVPDGPMVNGWQSR